MMIPIVKAFAAPAQVYGLRAEGAAGFGILQKKFASFETYQGTLVTVPLTDVVEFIRATHGTDQGNIWKAGLLRMMEHSLGHTSPHLRASAKAQWDSVPQHCKIDNTPLPHPVPDISYA